MDRLRDAVEVAAYTVVVAGFMVFVGWGLGVMGGLW